MAGATSTVNRSASSVCVETVFNILLVQVCLHSTILYSTSADIIAAEDGDGSGDEDESVSVFVTLGSDQSDGLVVVGARNVNIFLMFDINPLLSLRPGN
jgi:hypothetical protein